MLSLSQTQHKENSIQNATIKLTMIYVAVATTVATTITIVVISLFTRVLRSSIEYKFIALQRGAADAELFIEHAIGQLWRILWTVDVVLVLLVLVFGYFFARKTLQPIEEVLLKQKQFIENATHELKTPLAIMRAGLETTPTSDAISKEEFTELRKDLLEEIDSLDTVISDLLLLQKVTMDGDNNHNHNIQKNAITDFSLLCRQEVQRLAVLAEKKHISYKTDIEDGVYVPLSKQEATAVLHNIIKNAITYTPPEGKIGIKLHTENGKAIYNITDTGPGIASEDQPHIFERFFKARNNPQPTDGSGLGLSIVKTIVDKVGGSITVSSTEGEGSTFRIELPLVRRDT